jgi:hypothetical protein
MTNFRVWVCVTAMIAAGVVAAVAQRVPSAPANVRILPGPRSAFTTVTDGRSHEYFNSLVKLREHFRSWSLRSQPQLDELAPLGRSSYFTYVFGSDPYSTPQDGAKFYKSADDQLGRSSDSIPGNQQLRMPLRVDKGSLLITWDFWYGPEFRQNIDPKKLDAYKTFQLRQGGDVWWTHLNHFTRRGGSDEVAKVYDAVTGRRGELPAGISRLKPIQPTGEGALGARAFGVKYGVWTRYWLEVHLHVPADDPRWNSWKSTGPVARTLTGTWHMGSLWVADETRDPQRIIYRVPLTITASDMSSFDFEFNTSNKPPSQDGPLIGYGRNVVVLQNYVLPSIPEDDPRIFVRPLP